ncbi:hypothetical protein ACFQZT_01820 [Paenibacillus sp. GCM10027628]|uniref:hypothetical protein n=1 Tax=Paenibacillus sp. GCM10027628 TaxID=3273413 RepID=UPI0036288745
MEQLIAFVFKHWYLVIIVLTFFYQIRRKWTDASSNERNKRRTVQGMPSFGGSPGGPSKPLVAPRSSQGNAANTVQPKRPQRDYTKSEATVSDIQSLARKESPFSSPALSSDSAKAIDQASQSTEMLTIQPTGQQLLQGIVWAEILGPPRSKKPYRK